MTVCSFDPMGPELATRILSGKNIKGGLLDELPWPQINVREFPLVAVPA